MKRHFTLILFLSILFTSYKSYSSHALGGELRYTDLGNGNYEISFNLYRDCFGIPAPITVAANITSVVAAQNSTLTLVPDSPSIMMLQTTCSGAMSTCQGGTFLGVEKYVYKGTVFLAPAPDWVFQVIITARSAAITNMINPDATSMTIEANLNNSAVAFNNSPVFSNDPVTQLSINNSHVINNGIYDPDGDSLVIMFITPTDNGVPLNYQPGYTFNNPIMNNGTLMLDPSNGDLIVTPVNPEVDDVVFHVEEYRNGVLVGTTNREMAINVYASTNSMPSINYTFPFVATACYNDTIDLNIITSDIDLADSVFIDTIYSTLPAGYFQYTLTPGQHQNAHLLFYPDSTLISSVPYVFSIKVRDNSCPYYGTQFYSFRLFVNSCGPLVWPGDADSDLDADMYDVLPIGIGYSATGPARINASNNWFGQPATAWGQTFLSGSDYMHADCNGDGTIDSLDLQAISLNYGLNHPLRKGFSSSGTSSLTDGSLYISTSLDSICPDSVITLDLNLGNATSQITNLYGLAFRINFDAQIFDAQSGGIQFINSWVGNTNDLVLFKKESWSQGFIDVAISRLDGINVNGGGLIGHLALHVNPASTPTTTTFTLSGLKAISFSENVLNLAMEGDSVQIASTPTGITHPNAASQLTVFPNPVKAGAEIYISNENQFSHLRIYNVCGMILIESELHGNVIKIDSDRFKAGLYFVELSNQNAIVTGKIVVQE